MKDRNNVISQWNRWVRLSCVLTDVSCVVIFLFITHALHECLSILGLLHCGCCKLLSEADCVMLVSLVEATIFSLVVDQAGRSQLMFLVRREGSSGSSVRQRLR